MFFLYLWDILYYKFWLSGRQKDLPLNQNSTVILTKRILTAKIIWSVQYMINYPEV